MLFSNKLALNHKAHSACQVCLQSQRITTYVDRKSAGQISLVKGREKVTGGVWTANREQRFGGITAFLYGETQLYEIFFLNKLSCVCQILGIGWCTAPWVSRKL